MSANRPIPQLCPLRVMTITAGLILGLMLSLAPQPASAQACNLNANLCGTNVTRTSSLTVYHEYTDGGMTVHPVEPDTGETWSVTAHYQLVTAHTVCDCDIRSPSVSVDVDWNGSAWVASCTGCGAGSPILAVAVCPVDGCGEDEVIDHSWAYELIVDLANNHPFPCGGGTQLGALQQVDYLATSIDDGDTIDTENCMEDLEVTPVTTTAFGASDTGAFECPFTCADANGPTETIRYELP